MLRSPVGRVGVSLLTLTAVILLTFGNVLRNDFVNFDDQSEIIENPDFNPVTLEKLNWNWTHTRLTLYMPVTYFTWGAVAAIAPRDAHGVLKPIAFHALNLALHCLCAWLVFLLILQLWNRAFAAFIGAMVFGVHPLQAEPVAWASGMYTLLSTAFSLAALMFYTAHVRHKEMRNVERPTFNVQHRSKRRHFCIFFISKLEVGRWTLDVRILLPCNIVIHSRAFHQSRVGFIADRRRRDRSVHPRQTDAKDR